MPRTPTEIVEEQQARELLQDMKETKSAQDAAATETVPGDQLAAVQPVPADVPRGNPDLAEEKAIEEDPELLGRIQDPHRENRPEVKTAVFTTSYNTKVRAAI